MLKISFGDITEGRNPGGSRTEDRAREDVTETSLRAGGRGEGGFYPEKKGDESIKKCPDWLK